MKSDSATTTRQKAQIKESIEVAYHIHMPEWLVAGITTVQFRALASLIEAAHERYMTEGVPVDDPPEQEWAEPPLKDHVQFRGYAKQYTLVVGSDYEIVTRVTGVERYDRISRMGFTGQSHAGDLVFSARGPDRTHSNQYGGTQTIRPEHVKAVHKVESDHAKRYTARRYTRGKPE